MNVSVLSGYQLTPQQITDLHNAGCRFYHFLDRYRDVLGKQVIDDFQDGWKTFQRVREAISETENKVFDQKHSYYDKVKSDNGFSSIWSIYKVEDMQSKSHVVGATAMVYNSWGEKQTIELDPTHTYTWLELWTLADEMMLASGDNHHVFIEGFAMEDGAAHIITGS